MSDQNGDTPQQQQPIVQPTQVTPQPTPCSYAFKFAPVEDGQVICAFILHQVTGQNVTYWTPTTFNRLGQKIMEFSQPHMTGLSVAKNPPLWKPGDPG